MTFNTRNPIGSTDARDLSDNAENFDKALSSLGATWKDRFGRTRDSFEGRLAKGSFYRVGTFSVGYTLTNMRQTLEYSGHEYSWAGSFPKVVAAGSTPATTGGIGAGAWVDRTDDTLRSDINLVQKRFACVADMAADTSLAIGDIVETIGYYNNWVSSSNKPKGGNRYEIVAAGSGTADGGSFITLSNGLKAKGLFISGVDVCQFGAKGDGTTDDTSAIQAAINYSRSFVNITAGLTSTGGPVINIPEGVYAVTRIIRKSGVAIVGAGSRSTYFVALSLGSVEPYGMVEIDVGPVVSSHLKGITICGGATTYTTTPVNANQWGIYTHAKWNTASYGAGGGLWYSQYEDVYVKNFNFGEWSRAGYTWSHSLRPNQFIEYNSCTVLVNTDGIARRFTGQHGQISISGGDCGGYSGLLAYTAFFAGFDPDPSQTADNNSGHGESTSDVSGVAPANRAPELVKLTNGTSIQRSKLGADIRGTMGISFDAVWFESLGGAIVLDTAGGATVTNSRFASAADGSKLGSAGSGYIIRHGNDTEFNFGAGNVIAGMLDNVCAPSLDLAVTHKISMVSASKSTFGKTDILAPHQATIGSDGKLTIDAQDNIWVKPNTGDESINISNIDSFLMPSETLVLRAWTGPITLSNAGNIHLGGSTKITIGRDGFLTLKRVHSYSGREFWLISASKIVASSAPTSGYWAEGTIIWNEVQSPSVSPGWICTTSGIAGSTAVFKQMPALLAT